MKNLLNPKWIFLINTLPVILLFLIFYSQYTVASALLGAKSKELWLYFAIGLAMLSFASFAYAIWAIVKAKAISWIYALLTLIGNISFLYVYAQFSDVIVPFSVPQWIMSTDIQIYPGTFLMPTLAYSLFILMVSSVPKHRKANPWLNFLYSILIPLAWYLFTLLILPLWQNTGENFGVHTVVVVFISTTVLFLFFLSRGVYLLTNTYGNRFKSFTTLWKLILAILLPLIGLFVNNGLFKHALVGESPFGNFSSFWFYLVAVVNGVVLCLPTFKNHYYRLIRFFVLMVCFPYTLYFFFVFLPFLPLAVVAVIAIGIGFLMLAPLALFILQVNELYKEYVFFLNSYSGKMLALGLVIAFAIIPSLITINYLHDRLVLNNALNYVYEQQPNKTYTVNRTALKNVLTVLKSHKSSNRSDFSGEGTPYLSMYYNWLVLDNLVLSESKILTLERIFFGTPEPNVAKPIQSGAEQQPVRIANATVESHYDPKQRTWKSMVNFELKNPNPTNFFAYETSFELPVGCWISNYYLYIGKKKEMGILAEKKAALWVFSQIRNENRDPGILYYTSANTIAFKIFPFAKNETRKSGIEFVHKEPLHLTIDGLTLALGKTDRQQKSNTVQANQSVFIPVEEKQHLPLVQRQPEYHFVLDVSKNKLRNVRGYISRIEKYRKSNHLPASAIKLHFASAQSTELPYRSDWQKYFGEQDFEGGFYLEGTLKNILLNNLQKHMKVYPIVIVLTDNFRNAIMLQELDNLRYAFPEGDTFYELDMNHQIWEHHYLDHPIERGNGISKIPLQVAVFAWPNAEKPTAYLPNDSLASIALNGEETKSNTVLPKGSWEAALALQGRVMQVELGLEHQRDSYLGLIKQSMEAQILSPFTSFLVVENEAQKKALRRKQAEIMSGNKNLDPDEDTQSMDEPNLLILLGLILLGIGYRKRLGKRYVFGAGSKNSILH